MLTWGVFFTHAIITKWKHLAINSLHMTTVYTDGVFDTCWPMRRPKYFLASSNEKIMSNVNINLPSSMLPLLSPLCNGYLFHTVLQPCYGTLPILPSTDKTSRAHLFQPFDRIIIKKKQHNFVFWGAEGANSQKIFSTLRRKPGWCPLWTHLPSFSYFL